MAYGARIPLSRKSTCPMKKLWLPLSFIWICVAFEGIAAAQSIDLDVPLVRQDTLAWCWIASAEMVLRYLGVDPPAQCQIMERGYGAPPGTCCNDPAQCTRGGSITEIQSIVASYGGTTSRLDTPRDSLTLAMLLRQSIPIIAHLNLPTGGHFVVIRGIKHPEKLEKAMVHINDPSAPRPFKIPYGQLMKYWDLALYVAPGSHLKPAGLERTR